MGRGGQEPHPRPGSVLSDEGSRTCPGVRPYESADRAAVLVLGERLRIAVASGRVPGDVAAAVHGWVTSSVAGADGRRPTVSVAEDHGEVVGFVTVTERTHFTGEVEGCVGELAVAETGVRAGTDRALTAAAEAWGRDRGLRRLSLETGAANTGAPALYAALGYGEDDVRLSRALEWPGLDPPREHWPRPLRRARSSAAGSRGRRHAGVRIEPWLTLVVSAAPRWRCQRVAGSISRNISWGTPVAQVTTPLPAARVAGCPSAFSSRVAVKVRCTTWRSPG